ncbi:MAG: glycosyltransferase [Bacteroidia bacterium]|nr:glycosyltransferase [Bacteroidia bacterium]MDW8348483.1 glycosyltransferase [Bacteroidia bacterium]
MKIVIIGPAHPLRGGIADFNHALAAELQTQNHIVDIVSFSLQYPRFLFPGKTQYTDSPPPQNLHIHTKINSISPFNWLHVGTWIAKKINPDIIIVRFWIPFLAPALGTILKQMKKYIHSHIIGLCDNVIPHEKRPLDKILTRYFINQCDSFVVMSNKVLQDLRSFTEKPAICLPHPIYNIYQPRVDKKNARQQLNLPYNEKILLFFGFIRKYKGLDLLLEALPKIKNEVKLLIAGEFYGNEEYYLDKIKSSGLNERIYLHNYFIPQNKVHLYFSACDVVVQPYLSATQSGVTQVAYFFGKPMIVTDVGGLSEIVISQKSGLVCPVVYQDKQVDIIQTSYLLAKEIDIFFDLPYQDMEAFILSEDFQSKYSWSSFAKKILNTG